MRYATGGDRQFVQEFFPGASARQNKKRLLTQNTNRIDRSAVRECLLPTSDKLLRLNCPRRQKTEPALYVAAESGPRHSGRAKPHNRCHHTVGLDWINCHRRHCRCHAFLIGFRKCLNAKRPTPCPALTHPCMPYENGFPRRHESRRFLAPPLRSL